MNNKVRLIKNSIGLVVVACLGYVIYAYLSNFFSDNYEIEESPLKVEQVRTIAEISTVSYQDEVVVDTIELYKEDEVLDAYNPFDWDDIAQKAYNRNIKKRLTLIIKGEVLVGFDLLEKKVEFKQTEDTIWVEVPKATILDIALSPSNTSIFQEVGTWDESARKELETKAINQLKENVKKFELYTKAEINFEKVLKRLIINERDIIIQFSE